MDDDDDGANASDVLMHITATKAIVEQIFILKKYVLFLVMDEH